MEIIIIAYTVLVPIIVWAQNKIAYKQIKFWQDEYLKEKEMSNKIINHLIKKK